ncbi:hypothetical protein ACMD2_08992, partial [Ananas comosus]
VFPIQIERCGFFELESSKEQASPGFPHEKIKISDEKAPHSTGHQWNILSFQEEANGSYYFSWPLKAKSPVPINTMYSSGNNDSTNSSIDYSLETHEQEIQDLDYFDQADEYSQYEDAEDTYYNELINHESNHTLTAKFDL